MSKREILVVADPWVQGLDVAGPFEVFVGAAQWLAHNARGDRGYRVRLVAPGGARVACEAGLTFRADGGLEVLRKEVVDTLIVAGGAP